MNDEYDHYRYSSIMDVISILDSASLTGNELVPQYRAMQIANRALIAHHSMEKGFKDRLKKEGLTYPTSGSQGHHDPFDIGPTVELVPANGNGHAPAPVNGNGTNGHHDEEPEAQQSLFSWAEFMAEEPVKPRRNGKPQPATLSMFEWAMSMEQEKKSTTGTHYSGRSAYGDGLRFAIGIRRERYLVAGSGLMAPPLSGPC